MNLNENAMIPAQHQLQRILSPLGLEKDLANNEIMSKHLITAEYKGALIA